MLESIIPRYTTTKSWNPPIRGIHITSFGNIHSWDAKTIKYTLTWIWESESHNTNIIKRINSRIPTSWHSEILEFGLTGLLNHGIQELQNPSIVTFTAKN